MFATGPTCHLRLDDHGHSSLRLGLDDAEQLLAAASRAHALTESSAVPDVARRQSAALPMQANQLPFNFTNTTNSFTNTMNTSSDDVLAALASMMVNLDTNATAMAQSFAAPRAVSFSGPAAMPPPFQATSSPSLDSTWGSQLQLPRSLSASYPPQLVSPDHAEQPRRSSVPYEPQSSSSPNPLPPVSALLGSLTAPTAGMASSARAHNPLYKTELCRSWEQAGCCRYGDKCQFAHGYEELRQVQRHPKFKTKVCHTFLSTGICPYGSRCRFIHSSATSPQ